jgi:hypothetical protein
MVDIGSGVPSAESDVRLEDVMVSQPDLGHGGVIQHDFRKTTPNGFALTGFLDSPPAMLLDVHAKMPGPDMLFQSSYVQSSCRA